MVHSIAQSEATCMNSQLLGAENESKLASIYYLIAGEDGFKSEQEESAK